MPHLHKNHSHAVILLTARKVTASGKTGPLEGVGDGGAAGLGVTNLSQMVSPRVKIDQAERACRPP
jgi:hypothetical protein